MKIKYLLLLFTLLFSLIPIVAQSPEDDGQRSSYIVCDWGLLTIEHPLTSAYIVIQSPENYSAIDGTEFTLSGIGKGLFEGNVVVEVRTQDTVIFTEPTTLLAEAIDSEGDWSMNVQLDELEDNTQLTIRAFSNSPRDGAIIASDTLFLNANSMFGLPFVEIAQPLGGASVTINPLTIQGAAGAIFENNVVIEVRNFNTNEVLAETFATVNTQELAGSGEFSTEVELAVEAGTQLVIFAYEPPIADGEQISIIDTRVVIVDPFAIPFTRFVTIRADDPINTSDDVCSGVQFMDGSSG